jgi:predicted RNA binding protein YcfA (HicA-like mRNA interferase family)
MTINMHYYRVDTRLSCPPFAQPISRTFPGALFAGVLRLARLARTDGALPYGRRMAKAAWILPALNRDGWIETRRSGSHRVLVKGDQQRVWAYHDGVHLGGPALARIARNYGYSVDELRKL